MTNTKCYRETFPLGWCKRDYLLQSSKLHLESKSATTPCTAQEPTSVGNPCAHKRNKSVKSYASNAVPNPAQLRLQGFFLYTTSGFPCSSPKHRCQSQPARARTTPRSRLSRQATTVPQQDLTEQKKIVISRHGQCYVYSFPCHGTLVIFQNFRPSPKCVVHLESISSKAHLLVRQMLLCWKPILARFLRSVGAEILYKLHSCSE